MEGDHAGTKASTDAGHLDAATLLPSQGDAAPDRVVGTLDLNIGNPWLTSCTHAALQEMCSA